MAMAMAMVMVTAMVMVMVMEPMAMRITKVIERGGFGDELSGF